MRWTFLPTLQLVLSVRAAECNDATCCVPKATDNEQLKIVDPFKVCTIPDAPSGMGGGELELVCFNGGGSLFDSCSDGEAPTGLPPIPTSMGSCALPECLDSTGELKKRHVCRFSPAFDYPITCDFWSRSVGKQAFASRNSTAGNGIGAGQGGAGRQVMRATIHTALQGLAPKRFWVDQHRAKVAAAAE